MIAQKQVGIGIIGAGFLAETRARCYAQVSGYNARMVAVAARTEASASGSFAMLVPFFRDMVYFVG